METRAWGRRLAWSTAIFSLATGVSRILGLAREIVARRYFGVEGSGINAFTVAFQLPNLVRALVADAAVSSAFVPVFSELLEKGERARAWRVASTLFWLTLLVVGGLTALLILAAPLVIAPFDVADEELAVTLSRILFPIVALLGVSGIVVGILNSYEHFGVPALTPVFWNLAIIAGLVVGVPMTDSTTSGLYVYAGAILAGTVLQVLLPLPWLRGRDGQLRVAVDWRDPAAKQVLVLMVPVMLGLGLINFNALIGTFFASRYIDPTLAPATIDAAFRIYMLPQGMFSVAVATVLFPALSRFVARQDWDGLRNTQANGIRQIALLLIPSAAITIALAEPITRLVYQRGEFDAESTRQVSEALFWFSFSLPFSGFNLLLTRTFFSLQRPWTPTALAGVTLVINAAVSAALYGPMGIGGVVLGTVVATAAMTAGQAYYLRRHTGGLQLGTTLRATAKMIVAAALLGGVAYGTWWALDQALGRSFAAQLVSVGTAIALGSAAYAAAVLAMRIPEARQIVGLFARRFRGTTPS